MFMWEVHIFSYPLVKCLHNYFPQDLEFLNGTTKFNLGENLNRRGGGVNIMDYTSNEPPRKLLIVLDHPNFSSNT